MATQRDKVETNTQRIVRLETQLDALPRIERLLETQISLNEKRFKDQDKRMDCIEKDASFMKGRLIAVYSAITVIISSVVGWIVNKFN